ncbi:TldD/PmbA family protein [Streptomyces sp. NPDC098077]|uniref:TldD/PmbA family protein n=1 Tax=Streptomyces sp. NPDC098077 TaxID=3366093 RepID=UPI00382EECCB
MLLDPNLISSVLSASKGQPLDLVELFAEQTATSAMVMKNGRIVDTTLGRERGVGIRMQRGRSFLYSHANDLATSAVLDVARTASSLAVGLTSNGDHPAMVSSMVSTEGVESPYETSGGWGDAASPGDRERQASLLASVADLIEDGQGITSVSAVLRNEHQVRDIANSFGEHAAGVGVRERLAVTVVLGPRTSLSSGRASMGVSGDSTRLTEHDVRETVREAVRRAQAGIKVSPAPTGDLPVVLAPGTGAVLIHEACGHGLEADHLARRSSVFHDLLGQRVGPPGLHIVDDASLPGAWGSADFDDEGHRAGRTPLVEDGILVGFLWDLAHASSRDNVEPVNGRRQNYQCMPLPRMTNTLVLPGTVTADDIITDTAAGIYVARLGSGQVNTATGNFVFAAKEAYAIRNGRLCEPLAGCSLIGNGPDVLREIDAVGTDFAIGPPGNCGKDGQTLPVGYGQPTLRIRRGLTIGGTAA